MTTELRATYHHVIGAVIQFHLTWPRHPRFTVEETTDTVVLTPPSGEPHAYRPGELSRAELVADVRQVILDHADTRGLRPASHSTWKGAPWCAGRP